MYEFLYEFSRFLATIWRDIFAIYDYKVAVAASRNSRCSFCVFLRSLQIDTARKELGCRKTTRMIPDASSQTRMRRQLSTFVSSPRYDIPASREGGENSEMWQRLVNGTRCPHYRDWRWWRCRYCEVDSSLFEWWKRKAWSGADWRRRLAAFSLRCSGIR